jgi:hypothetical protein
MGTPANPWRSRWFLIASFIEKAINGVGSR